MLFAFASDVFALMTLLVFSNLIRSGF